MTQQTPGDQPVDTPGIDIGDPASGGWIAKPEDRQGFTPREVSEVYDEAGPDRHVHELAWKAASAELISPRRQGPVSIASTWRVTAGPSADVVPDVVVSIEEAHDDRSCEIREPLARWLAETLPTLVLAADGERVYIDPAPAEGDDGQALRHFVRRAMGGMTSRCELTADKPDIGRCPRPAAAVRLEDGFSDVVCAEHAANAETRGAQVLRP